MSDKVQLLSKVTRSELLCVSKVNGESVSLEFIVATP
jgi:hypothetical protein